MARDNFTPSVKVALAMRVAYKCANPACNTVTIGPHTDISKTVNIGVACHITAASSGGPRFDPLLSAAERVSHENGIWLCQTCAKRVDNDEDRYPQDLLRRWKVEAEAAADRALGGASIPDFFPQPSAAIHTPIPRIAGLSYEQARPLLMAAGWQPFGYSMAHSAEPSLQSGNGQYFWQKGYHEIIDACPTGLAYCRFGYHDVYGNRLTIVTAGEVFTEHGTTAYVYSWHFEDRT